MMPNISVYNRSRSSIGAKAFLESLALAANQRRRCAERLRERAVELREILN
jgi:hypothetical protein